MTVVSRNDFKQSGHKSLFVLLVAVITCAETARAENWQFVGSDKDAFGDDLRIIKIDLDSVLVTTSEVTVKEETSGTSGLGNVGYNCNPGELRHNNVPKDIATLICNRQSSPHPFRGHTPEWHLIPATSNSAAEELDLNSIIRVGDEVTVTVRGVLKPRIVVMHFDCKGYYSGGGAWINLDMTDHLATVPRGFVSLERKTSDRVCAIAHR